MTQNHEGAIPLKQNNSQLMAQDSTNELITVPGTLDQLRRLSPLPPQYLHSNHFPTVVELDEPSTPSGSEEVDSSLQENPQEAVYLNGHHHTINQVDERERGKTKQRRKLPALSSTVINKNNNSSRSFDSGISNLLSESPSSVNNQIAGEPLPPEEDTYLPR